MNNQIHPVLVLELPTGTKLDQYNLGHQDGRCLRSPGCWRGLAGAGGGGGGILTRCDTYLQSVLYYSYKALISSAN